MIGIQTRKRPSTSDDNPAGRRPREQRAHLFGIGRVVQNDEQPLTVESRTVQGRPHLRIVPYVLARHPQPQQKRHQNRRRVGRRVRCGLQIRIQETVGKPAPELMGDVNGQCRLTDAGLPGYRRDDYTRTDIVRFEQGEEIGNLLLPTGEVSRTRGKLGRHRMARRGAQPSLFSRRDPTKGRLVREDRPLPFPHRGGFDSKITGSAQRVHADGGGILPATVAVKGQRQIQLQAFVGRILRDQPAQYRNKRPVPTGRQICGGPFLFRMQTQLAQSGRITLDEGTPFKICQWFSAPELQCLIHPVGSARHVFGIPQPPGLLNQSEKNQFIELVRPDLENVAAGIPRQGLPVGLPQHPPKTENVHPQPMQVFAPILFAPTAIALHGA